jgi:pilus assembly protein Flp/PilA
VLSSLYLRLQELVESAKAKVTEREEGQGMVEYALILVLIAVVVIVILQVVGRQVNNVFSNISNGLNQ